jgi:hypothetical protein
MAGRDPDAKNLPVAATCGAEDDPMKIKTTIKAGPTCASCRFQG